MNKYLEKIASWKNPSKFIGYVTGAAKKETGAKVKHMEEALANKHSLDYLKNQHTYTSDQTMKARIAAGVGGVGAVAGGALGYKKVRDHQDKVTLEEYNKLFKQAGVGDAAKTIAQGGGSAVWNTLKTVGRTTADLMNTSGGGKIKDYAARHGFKPNDKNYKKFIGSDLKGQVKSILRKQNVNRVNTGPKTRASFIKEHTQNLGNLHRNQRDARIALTATGAAGVSAYGWKKARDAQKKNKTYY